MQRPDVSYPEPVPAATQLAVLPFLAGVDGFLRGPADVPDLRITIHRAMSREGEGYLQQMCGYIRADGVDFQSAGRTFRMDHGIIGAAFESGSVWRTRRYDDVASLLKDLSDDMKTAGDTRALESVAKSYLAIPFLGPVHEGKQEPREIVTILYADCGVFNFFADGDRVRHLVEMCEGFCRLFDSLQRCPFPKSP